MNDLGVSGPRRTAPPRSRGRRPRSGFRAATFASLVVMAVAGEHDRGAATGQLA